VSDLTTWIDVADNATKIGLGALIGGGFGVMVAWLNNRSQAMKVFQERRRVMLETVTEAVDGACNAASLFWAKLGAAVTARDSQQRIADSDLRELKKLERTFFASYTVINSSASKLLLLGEASTEARLRILRSSLEDFWGIADLSNPLCTEQSLAQYKSSISLARGDFYAEISRAYRRDA